MKQRWISSAAVALSLLTLAACGGGASGTAVPSLSPGSSAQSGLTGMAKFVVSIPHTSTSSSSLRNPKYITSAVQGIDFTVSAQSGPGTPPSTAPVAPLNRGYVFYALTPQSTYCTNGASALTCTLAVQAYPGADLITVNTYGGSNPNTSPIISTGYVTANIVPGIDNPINITTQGVVTYMIAGVDMPYPPVGTPLTQPLRLTALDASYNIIIGNFDMPLSAASTDTTGGITVSNASITGSSTVPNVVYTGANVAANITVQTTSPYVSWNTGNNYSQAGVQFVPNAVKPYATPSTVQFTHANSAPQTVTLKSANGGSTAFSVNPSAKDYMQDPACAGIVTASVSGSTLTITPVKAGVCGLVLNASVNTGSVAVVVSP